MLVDEVELDVEAGHGGSGAVSFRREKFVPRGGPDGGNGGVGGSIYLVASRSHNTLAQFRYRPSYRAERGHNGEGTRRAGKSGESTELKVPVGTLVHDADTGECLGDLTQDEERLMVAEGGHGGRGNACFISSTNQAPRRAEPGGEGQKRRILLELRLLADVGLVGFPNAGKSTFISRVSAARPKIADYPFTTLEPNLGVVDVGEEDGFVIADVPGLIPGASEGAGLGHRFLRHLTRTSVLALIVDVSDFSGRRPAKDLEDLKVELVRFGHGLSQKPRVVVANKLDTLQDASRLSEVQAFAQADRSACFSISAVTGEGCPELVAHLAVRVRDARRGEVESYSPGD